MFSLGCPINVKSKLIIPVGEKAKVLTLLPPSFHLPPFYFLTQLIILILFSYVLGVELLLKRPTLRTTPCICFSQIIGQPSIRGCLFCFG